MQRQAAMCGMCAQAVVDQGEDACMQVRGGRGGAGADRGKDGKCCEVVGIAAGLDATV